jgi:Uma2 family endonuclease
MPKKPPRRVATRLLRAALEHLLPQGWYVDSQEPITTADSEPEPDVMIVRGETRQYLDRHPGAEELGLVVEVADATLERDRNFKKELYAAAGIEVYWIVNLPESTIEAYADPAVTGDSADYRLYRDYSAGEAIPVHLDGAEIGRLDVGALLP